MLSVLAEILNFTTMLSLFAKSPDWDEMYKEERIFTVWLFVEALVVISTVAVNIVYVMVRSCAREAIEVGFEVEPLDQDSTPDYNKDFLSSTNN